MPSFNCPNCDSPLHIPDSMAGELTLCAECRERIRVPRPDNSIRGDLPPRRSRPKPSSEPEIAVDIGRPSDVGSGFRFGLGFGAALIAISLVVPVLIVIVCSGLVMLANLRSH